MTLGFIAERHSPKKEAQQRWKLRYQTERERGRMSPVLSWSKVAAKAKNIAGVLRGVFCGLITNEARAA